MSAAPDFAPKRYFLPGPQPIATGPGMVPWCTTCGDTVGDETKDDGKPRKPHDLLRVCLPILERDHARLTARLDAARVVLTESMKREAANG
jgi:hypothetical protein